MPFGWKGRSAPPKVIDASGVATIAAARRRHSPSSGCRCDTQRRHNAYELGAMVSALQVNTAAALASASQFLPLLLALQAR